MAYGTIRADIIEGTNVSIDLSVAGEYSFAGNVLPDADNTRDLGSASLRFAAVYTSNLLTYGNVTLGDSSSDTIAVNGRVTTDIVPSTDNSVNLGSASLRFANIYTGDLHLANDRGDWTVIEEAEYLSLRNNKTGKTFRLVMEEVEG